jgi:phosphatidylglycerol lysyltransferase
MKTLRLNPIFVALLLAFLLGGLGPVFAQQQTTTAEKISLKLQRGNFVVLHFPVKLAQPGATPKALLIFGSGGGGWSDWEERVCHFLASDGYDIWAIDYGPYTADDYFLNTLQADHETIVERGEKIYGSHPLPVIIGGWSTGAEQAVAVAGGPRRPDGLVGLLLISPGSWSGYGCFASHDLGPRLFKEHTFDLVDFAPTLPNVRIAQWHANLDILDSRSWLTSLKVPHREYDFADAFHEYQGASDVFLGRLSQSLDWILNRESNLPSVAGGEVSGNGGKFALNKPSTLR